MQIVKKQKDCNGKFTKSFEWNLARNCIVLQYQAFGQVWKYMSFLSEHFYAYSFQIFTVSNITEKKKWMRCIDDDLSFI